MGGALCAQRQRIRRRATAARGLCLRPLRREPSIPARGSASSSSAASSSSSSSSSSPTRLPPKAWHECVAITCGFHACVVGQSLYEPQLRAWLNTFSAPQFAVTTLDEFADKPRATLGRLAAFLGVGAFPRLVLNWKWNWNVGGQSGKKRRSAKRQAVSDETLSQLRRFFAPYNDALGALLRRRGQARSAAAVARWPRA